VLTVGQEAVLNFSLAVGALAEAVTVMRARPLWQLLVRSPGRPGIRARYNLHSSWYFDIYCLPIIISVNDPGSGGPVCMRPGVGGGAFAGSGPYSNALVIT
jgi:hypothetical protein